MKALMEIRSSTVNVYHECLWICLDCVQERGYRIPPVGHVNASVTKCACCGKYGLVLDRDDLLAANE